MFRPQDRIALRREPENPHDRDAIAVHVTRVVGFGRREDQSALEAMWGRRGPNTRPVVRFVRPSTRDGKPTNNVTLAAQCVSQQ